MRREFAPTPPPVARVSELVWDTPAEEPFRSSSLLLPAKIFTLGLVMVPPYWLDSLPLTSI